jgi:N utilization substance protein A
LVGWDIEIMTHDELNEGLEKAENWFRQIPGTTDELVEAFIEEGFLSYDDLTFLEPAQLAELAGCTEDQAEEMITFAEEAAERVEEENRIAQEAAAAAEAQAPEEAGAKASSSPTAADLFPADTSEAPTDAKPTLESLFGPDLPTSGQSNLSAQQVLGEEGLNNRTEVRKDDED